MKFDPEIIQPSKADAPKVNEPTHTQTDLNSWFVCWCNKCHKEKLFLFWLVSLVPSALLVFGLNKEFRIFQHSELGFLLIMLVGGSILACVSSKIIVTFLRWIMIND